MNYNPIPHYFSSQKKPWLTPLAVNVITEGDYHLYLFSASDSRWYVVIEADHLTLPTLIEDVELSFPVRVEGLNVLAKYQGIEGGPFLPPTKTSLDYDHLIYQHRNAKYALLSVAPKEGVDEKNSGFLTFLRKSKRMKRVTALIVGIVFIVLGIGLIIVVITSNKRTPEGQLIWIQVLVAGGALIAAGIRLLRNNKLRDIFEDLFRGLR